MEGLGKGEGLDGVLAEGAEVRFADLTLDAWVCTLDAGALPLGAATDARAGAAGAEEEEVDSVRPFLQLPHAEAKRAAPGEAALTSPATAWAALLVPAEISLSFSACSI